VWEPEYGDRRQEFVFIGVEMDRAAIEQSLDEALLTEHEMLGGPSAWAKLPDPFAAMSPERAAVAV